MRKSLLVSLLAFSAVPAFVAIGCADSFKDCQDTATCEPPEGGDGDMGTGGSGDGDGDTGGSSVGGEGGEPSGSACDPECGDDEVGDEDAGECVGCLGDDDCDDGEVCDTDNDVCVGCVEDADCADPTTPICDANECVGCSDDESCGDLGNRCLGSGECVECTPETDDRTVDTDDCGTGVCDPADNSCRDDLTQGDAEACEPCVADAQCVGDHSCVPMDYDGDDRGGYCLKNNAGGCTEPYLIDISGRGSLSGEMGETYCGINEALATCEAVLALLANTPCSDDNQCPEGGLCRKVGSASGKRCTYECSSPFQCDEGPNPGSSCGAGAMPEDPVTPDYCGGDDS